jgi:hypothetical protein
MLVLDNAYLAGGGPYTGLPLTVRRQCHCSVKSLKHIPLLLSGLLSTEPIS